MGKTLYTLALIIFLLSSISAFGDPPKEDSTINQTDVDIITIPIIEDFSDHFTIRPYITIPLQTITISHYNNNTGNQSKDITYQPNLNACIGGGISYWIFGISYHVSFPDTPQDERLYGNTRYFNLMGNFYYRKFGFDVFYRRFREFYLEDSLHDFGIFAGTYQAKRTDLSIASMGGNIFYVFSDNYSYNANFKQDERQNYSGGSFILMASVINYNIDSNYSLIPLSQEIFYGVDSSFRAGNFTSFGISPGYSHTFILWHHYYIAPSLSVGSGVMKKSYITMIGKRNKIGSFIKVNARIGIGYNGDRWYYGASGIFDLTTSQSFLSGSGIAITTMIGYIELFVGFRL